MPKTTILQPFEGENIEVYRKKYKLIQESLDKLIEADERLSFKDFLLQINMNEEEYMKCVQTSIKGPKVFLKRETWEGRINPYMNNLLSAWGANHDLQYITDPYACVMYIISYISKKA